MQWSMHCLFFSSMAYKDWEWYLIFYLPCWLHNFMAHPVLLELSLTRYIIWEALHSLPVWFGQWEASAVNRRAGIHTGQGRDSPGSLSAGPWVGRGFLCLLKASIGWPISKCYSPSWVAMTSSPCPSKHWILPGYFTVLIAYSTLLHNFVNSSLIKLSSIISQECHLFPNRNQADPDFTNWQDIPWIPSAVYSSLQLYWPGKKRNQIIFLRKLENRNERANVNHLRTSDQSYWWGIEPMFQK